MQTIQFILGYCIIHLICVIYMYKMFESQDYIPDELDNLMVWFFAPEIIVITFIKAIGGK